MRSLRYSTSLALVSVLIVPSCSSQGDSTNGGDGVPQGDSGSTSGDAASSGSSSGAGGSPGSASGAGSGSSGGSSGSGTASGVTPGTGSGSGASSGGPSDAGSGSGASSDARSDSQAGGDAGTAMATCPDAGSGAQTCGSNAVAQTFNAGLTYYQQTQANNCGMPWPADGMYTALSTNLYDQPSGSGSCGKCVQVNGKTLIVVDQCPQATNPAQCSTNHLDLSPTAYQAVQGSLNPGTVSNSPGLPVKFVPCPVAGNISYSFGSSSQQYYLALIVLNTKYGISKVEYRAPNSCGWTAMGARSDGDAHFTINGVMVPNPIDLRVTDEWGHVLEDHGLHWTAGQSATGSGQFPTCQ